MLARTAQAEYERVEDIAKEGLVTAKELEAARQSAEVSELDQKLESVRLEDHIVRAPFDGLITTRGVELGQTVTMGQVLLGLAEALCAAEGPYF